MLELATRRFLKLNTIASLFEALHANGISYCNLKGNDRHLEVAMTGESDVDVLFGENQKAGLESILYKLGFKRFNAIKQRRYKDIFDFIALDLESGKLIHLHAYFRLTIGEPYLKGYQLDIENHLLNNRVYNDEFRMYCIHPAFEFILLHLTESLKLRHRDLISMRLKNKIHVSEKAVYEYNWLKNKTNDAEVENALKLVFNDYNSINILIKSEFNRKQLHKLAQIIKKEFSVFRLYSPLRALLLRWYREVTVLTLKKLSRILNRPVLTMRTNPRGGIIVAVIGADGSGKSTTTNELKETFIKKINVYKIYFGRGEGRISPGRKLLTSVKIFWTRKKDGKIENQGDTVLNKDGFLRSSYKCIEALLVALEKLNNLKMMQIAKKKGSLVICDRYPQNQIMGYNDGPLLHDLVNSKNPIFRAIAKIESKIYARVENHTPDILFKLIADAEVAEKRKPGEIPIEKLVAKIEGIKKLRFNSKCKVVTIDATRPLNEVLYRMKKEIWTLL